MEEKGFTPRFSVGDIVWTKSSNGFPSPFEIKGRNVVQREGSKEHAVYSNNPANSGWRREEELMTPAETLCELDRLHMTKKTEILASQ
jgi:hypothetical protein